MWEKIVKNLSQKISQPKFESWVRPIKFLDVSDFDLRVAVSSDYAKDWIIKNIYKEFKTAILEETGKDLTLRIIVDKDLEPVKPETTLPNKPEAASNKQIIQSKLINLRLNLKHTFDSYIVGENNKFAYAIARTVADKPGRIHNPLFIYGGVGLGKTHLMQAIGHHIITNNPDKKVKYVSTETFTNDLIESIRRKTPSDFRKAYRGTDLLLLDDVQFLNGKEMTQDELFNTFNALHEMGKQVVFSSDRHPKDIPKLADRLLSRFEWGVTVDLQAPDLETRIAILQNKAKQDGMDIPTDVLELIATSYQNNIRELEGALNRVIAYVGVTGCPMTVNAIQGLIESTSKVKKISPDKIIDFVAEFYKITPGEILGSSRKKEVSLARQVSIYLIREITKSSFPTIGDFFSKKHSTIIYAYEKIKAEMQKDRLLGAQVNDLQRKLT